MLNGCEWLRCILAYLEWLLWDHTENESDLTCNNTTFQDVYLKKPPPPSTLYKVWATQQDSLQQRDQKKTTRCQRCLWLVSGSREFPRDSAFSRSWCPARSWGGRLFSIVGNNQDLASSFEAQSPDFIVRKFSQNQKLWPSQTWHSPFFKLIGKWSQTLTTSMLFRTKFEKTPSAISFWD